VFLAACAVLAFQVKVLPFLEFISSTLLIKPEIFFAAWAVTE
jgi:hypothetical protein